MTQLSVEQFKAVMPQNHKGSVNQDLMDKINIDNDDVLPVSYVIEDTLKLY